MIQKIIHDIVHKPVFFFIIWFIYLTLPLFYILRFLFLQNFIAEHRFLQHLLSLFLLISNSIPAILVILFIIHFKRFYINKLPKPSKKNLRAFLILSMTIVVVGMVLLTVEQNYYPNYLYSTIGMPYDVLDLMVKLNLLFVVTIVFISITAGKEIENITRLLAAFAFIILINQSLFPLINFNRLTQDSLAGPELKYGLIFKDMPGLLSKTPQNSNFIHPPQQDELPFVSNQPMMRYFLFPRTLISGTLVNSQKDADMIKEAYFYDIGSYKNDQEWPLINLSNKKITFNQEKDAKEIRYKDLKLIIKGKESDLYKVTF